MSKKRPHLSGEGFIDLEEPVAKKKPTASTSNGLPKVSVNGKTKKISAPELMFVDKYKPRNTSQIIGQTGDRSNAKKLLKWLQSWHEKRASEASSKGKGAAKKPRFGGQDDGSSFKAALLSGPPGIGKTTTAQLVCAEAGFVIKELNASDARSKKLIQEELTTVDNKVLDGYFTTKASQSVTGMKMKHVLVMDEVDGMAGNEDRGGMAELILLIKKSKIPIICICNDRSSPKVRSLTNYCFDLRFYKPQPMVIKSALSSIVSKEGITIDSAALEEIVASSNQDIRQAVHYLNLMSISNVAIHKTDSKKAMKDVKLGPFEAIKKVFPPPGEVSRMSIHDKSDLFFFDYNLMPLMVFENYLKVQNPNLRTNLEKMQAVTRSIDALAFGDILEKKIRTDNNWSLLPQQAMFSTVMPCSFMSGTLNAMPMFPTYLGKISNKNKRDRLLQELKCHMNLKISGSKTSLSLDYLEPLRDAILKPLLKGDIDGTVSMLNSYYLRKEDLDAIMELTSFAGEPDPFSKIEPKTKAALTRAINKSSELLPYSISAPIKKGKGVKTTDDYEEEDGAGNDVEMDDGEEGNEDDPTADGMVKIVKKTAKAKIVIDEETISNGNGEKATAKKGTAKKESVKKETVKKESVKKESVKKETVKKEPVKKEPVAKKATKKESVKPEKVTKKETSPKKKPTPKKSRKRVIVSSSDEDSVQEISSDEEVVPLPKSSKSVTPKKIINPKVTSEPKQKGISSYFSKRT